MGTYGRKDIHNFYPCVVQDINPVGPLPKKGNNEEGQKVSVPHLLEATFMCMNDSLGERDHLYNTLSQLDMC